MANRTRERPSNGGPHAARSYLRDLEQLRRFKEALTLDNQIDADIREVLTIMFETVHTSVGLAPNSSLMRQIIAAGIARMLDCKTPQHVASKNG